MAYKIIKEWKSRDGSQHEITVYKYNYTKDEMVRYFKEGNEILIQTHVLKVINEEYIEGTKNV